jgi:DNA-binding transcriptional MerR regulator
MSETKLLTLSEVAKLLNVTLQTVINWRDKGLLASCCSPILAGKREFYLENEILKIKKFIINKRWAKQPITSK